MVTKLMVLNRPKLSNNPPTEPPCGDCIMTDRGWKSLFQLDCSGSTQRVTYSNIPFHVNEMYIDMPTPDTFRQELKRRLISSTRDYEQMFVEEQKFRRK